MTDRELMTAEKKARLGNLLGSTAAASVDDEEEKDKTFTKIADTATSTTTDAGIWNLTKKVRIESVYYLPAGSGTVLTSSSTDYATISLEYDDGAGGADTQVAVLTTKTTGASGSGDWTGCVPVALTVTRTLADIASGKLVHLKIAKAAAGVVVPAGVLQVNYREI